MYLTNIKQLKENGFSGFKTISELFADTTAIPHEKGVYVIIRNKSDYPEFLSIGSGGDFKKKNPNVDVTELKQNWIENAQVIYIGKAGGGTNKSTLNKRLKQYLKFGQGKSVGHWGGRYIWQLADCDDLLVAWKPLPKEDPGTIESEMINQFKANNNGKRPFANLRD